MKLSPQAINILKRVRENILKKPESYCHDHVSNDCGTVMCIAGHINLLCGANYKIIGGYKGMQYAANSLGLDSDEVKTLFCTVYEIKGITMDDRNVAWGLTDATPHERAAIGAKIIDAFINQHS